MNCTCNIHDHYLWVKQTIFHITLRGVHCSTPFIPIFVAAVRFGCILFNFVLWQEALTLQTISNRLTIHIIFLLLHTIVITFRWVSAMTQTVLLSGQLIGLKEQKNGRLDSELYMIKKLKKKSSILVCCIYFVVDFCKWNFTLQEKMKTVFFFLMKFRGLLKPDSNIQEIGVVLCFWFANRHCDLKVWFG